MIIVEWLDSNRRAEPHKHKIVIDNTETMYVIAFEFLELSKDVYAWKIVGEVKDLVPWGHLAKKWIDTAWDKEFYREYMKKDR